MTDLFNSPLADVDPEVAEAIGHELDCVVMGGIASILGVVHRREG